MVDAGRLTPRSPAARLVAASDAALLVVADDLAQLKRAKEALPALRGGVRRLGLVVTGHRPDGGQIGQALGLSVLEHLPTDPKADAFVRSGTPAAHAGRRPLLRAARSLAAALADALHPDHVPAPPSAPLRAGAA